MCGFVTIYQTAQRPLEPKVIEAMTASLAHRGPDDYGFAAISANQAQTWREHSPLAMSAPNVVMGHRRLSIIDLSSVGRQPFVSDDGRYWMVYNGEIYNYIELRQCLESLGKTFTTQTDTEVLLVAYQTWGTECFSRLNGMWSLVIWDQKNNTLIACRDRFGIKPLYYFKHQHDWLLASEIKAFAHFPGVKLEPDLQATCEYLRTNSIPVASNTFYKDIQAVEPGTYITFEQGKKSQHHYWQLPMFDTPAIKHTRQAKEAFLALFQDSIRLRLRSNVPVGTMLSGGLDSTSIISIIAELHHGAASDLNLEHSIQAFTASFPGAKIDETERVDELCGKLNCQSHKILPTQQGNVENLAKQAVYFMEMPFNSAIPIVNMLLMRKAKAEGVSVVLNGHAADEMLAGYPGSYCAISATDELRRLNLPGYFNELKGIKQRQGISMRYSLSQTKNHWQELALKHDSQGAQPDSYDHLFDPQVLDSLFRSQASKIILTPGRSGLDRLLRLHFSHRMLPRWLQMEDRISMSASVESRLPFLDYRLVESIFSMADRLKIRKGVTKFILRHAMAQRLPHSIVSDSQKAFFPGPNIDWLLGPLRHLVEDCTLENAYVAQFFVKEQLSSTIRAFYRGEHKHVRFIWRVLNTELWMQSYFNRD